MQAPECKFRLPNGHKCRCVATRHQSFCRHHGAQPAPRPKHDARRANWRELTTFLPHLAPSEIPPIVRVLLESLLHDDHRGVSDRYAGRTLRALLRRHGSVPAIRPDGPGSAPSRPVSAQAPAPRRAPLPLDSRALAEEYPQLAAVLQQSGLAPSTPGGPR